MKAALVVMLLAAGCACEAKPPRPFPQAGAELLCRCTISDTRMIYRGEVIPLLNCPSSIDKCEFCGLGGSDGR
mgnify:CR=1 FL=1